MNSISSMRALLTVLSVFVALASCNQSDDNGNEIELSERRVPVEILVLESQPWSYSIESFGRLSVADTVRIGVESAGTVTELKLAEGKRVFAGDLLFALDEKKQQLRKVQSEASLDEARSNLEQVHSKLRRLKVLREDGAVSEDQLVEAQTNHEAAIARLDQSRALLAIANTELADRRIVSPVNGIVEAESVEIGQQVQPGQILVTIQADGDYQVSAFVNEREVLHLAAGQLGQVDIAGAIYSATIESVGRKADVRTGNYEVKLRIHGQADRLREGMSAVVRVDIETSRSVLLVPRTAIVDRNRKRVVFVEEDGVASSREVQFGLPSDDYSPVISGLSAGERLIVSSLEFVTNGTSVVATEK